MDGAITCAACGSRTRDDRTICPRCKTPIVTAARDSKVDATRPTPLMGVAFLVVAVLIGGSVWLRGGSSSSIVTSPVPPVDPRARESAPQVSPAHPAVLASTPGDRRFMEPPAEGAVAYADGDYARSLERYQAAITKNPDDAEALSNLGQVMVRSGKVEEAIPYFDRAIGLIPQRWAYRFNRARALGILGRTKEAVADYREAQQLFPNDYATAFNLGLSLHKLGDEAGAVEAYRKAIELDPNDATFHMALGTSLERLQRRGDAAIAFETYLRLAPSAPDAESVRARVAQLTQPSQQAPGPDPRAATESPAGIPVPAGPSPDR